MKTISSVIKKILLRIFHFLIVVFFCFIVINGVAQSTTSSTETQKVLSRINLNFPGLEKVKQSQKNPEIAVNELLKYYQNRTFIKHPIQNTPQKNTISEKDLKWANDALEHVFVGQPAYPAHFCGDDINWETRPVADNEWVWQLNRMAFWDAMAKVYAQTGDEKYAEEWGKQLIDWTVKNPRDKDHQYAWRSIEAGIRGYRWTGLFHQFIHSPHFTPEVLMAFLNSCYDHAEYLMTKYTTRSNWGLMEAEGMAFIAITFPEFEKAEKWREEAFRRLNNEINIQVYPDGHQRELAMGYHLGCINWFLRTYELAKLNGIDDAFPDSYLARIEKMCEVPMKLCLPNGANVQFGDAWEGSPGQHSGRFKNWAEFFGRDDFLYLSTSGEEGKQPDSTAYALPVSGLYSMRSAWNEDAVCLVLKCGPDGGGHCQPDNGTFDLYAGGRNLMPDAGSYIYSGDPENRAWFRQTKVHQTLTLNGKNSDYAPKLLKWQPGEDLDILVVENKSYENKSYEKLSHRRAVVFVDKRYFIIVDEAIGDGIGDVDIHFQLAPDAGAAPASSADRVFNRDSFSVHTNFPQGYNVFVQTQKQNGLELSEEEGQVSFEYTKKEPRPAFRYRLKKEKPDSPVRFVTLVVPFENEVPKIEITQAAVESGKVEIEVMESGVKKRIAWNYAF